MDSELIEILHKQFNFEIPEAEAFLALSDAVPDPDGTVTPVEVSERTGFQGDVPELLDFASNNEYVARSGEGYSLTDKGRHLIDQLRGDN